MTEHIDMAAFVEAKSDQLNSDDLIGGPRTITITKVTGNDGDQPISIHYQGDNGKPFKPCKTIRRVLLAIWGRNASEYVGRSMTLYRDDSVTFGGLNVGGIRISHMSHLEKETVVVVMKTKGKKAGIKVLPLKDAPAAQAAAPTTDFNAVLADLKKVAQPGNMDALGAAWKDIGPEARKALAAELPALKAACEKPVDDVPFDGVTADPAAAKAADLLTSLETATDAAAVEAAVAEYEKHRAALTDDQAISVETAISQARAKFEVQPA